jgi:hypothetical protein
MKTKTLIAIAGLLLVGGNYSSYAMADTIAVKYKGAVNLKNFDCIGISSSLVHRICYRNKAQYLVVLLNQTYYHYCRIPPPIVEQWLKADSKGKFYLTNIKGNFDCRLGGIPSD